MPKKRAKPGPSASVVAVLGGALIEAMAKPVTWLVTPVTPGSTLSFADDLVEVGQGVGGLAAAEGGDAEEAHRGLGLGGDEDIPGVVADEGVLDALGGRVHEGVADDEYDDAEGQEHADDEALGLVLQEVPEGYSDEYRHGI